MSSMVNSTVFLYLANGSCETECRPCTSPKRKASGQILRFSTQAIDTWYFVMQLISTCCYRCVKGANRRKSNDRLYFAPLKYFIDFLKISSLQKRALSHLGISHLLPLSCVAASSSTLLAFTQSHDLLIINIVINFTNVVLHQQCRIFFKYFVCSIVCLLRQQATEN